MIAHEKLSALNILLLCASLAVGTVVVINVVTFSDHYNLNVSAAQQIDLPALDSFDRADDAQSFQNLKNEVTKKRLFRPLIKPKAVDKNIPTIETLTRDLLLIGVVQQDQLEAIIKNRRTRQTYFVKQGTSIGQVTVEKVQDDKVILSYQDTKKELFIQ